MSVDTATNVKINVKYKITSDDEFEKNRDFVPTFTFASSSEEFKTYVLLDDYKKLQERVAELTSDVEQYERASQAQSRQWEKLRQDYAELLEQANKLEEALSRAGHLEEPEDLNSDRTCGYLMACEDVIDKAKPILTQFAEWKNKNK